MAKVNWMNERAKLNRVLEKASTSLSIMRREAKRSGTLLAEAQFAAQQRDAFARSRALPLAAEAYNARVNAEAARFEAAYFTLAADMREDGLNQAMVAAAVQDAQRRQPLVTSAETTSFAADTMEQAAEAAGNAARDKAPPLPADLAQVQQPSGGDMSMQPSMGWRPKVMNESINNFFPPDVRAAAGGFGALGDAGNGTTDPATTSWWDRLKKAFGAGVAAAGNEAAKEGQATAKDDPAAGAALNAGGGTLQWLSTLLGADYQAAAKKPAPSAPFPWVPVLIGTGLVGVAAFAIFGSMHKK